MIDCLLCSYVSDREPAEVVYKDELVLAMMARRPANPGHLLITPAQHVERLAQISEEAGMHLFRIAMRMQRAIESSGIKCEGTYLSLAEGEGAFQIVPHIYIDLVPRFRYDWYWIQATIDLPYARPDALVQRLFDDRVQRLLVEARRANASDSDSMRIDETAARIRDSYAAIWGHQ